MCRPPEAKDEQRASKAAKFAAKQAKLQGQQQKNPQSELDKKPTPSVPTSSFVDDTPAGQKKKLYPFDHPSFQAYSPSAIESSWYSWWESSGFFKPQFTADGQVLPVGKFVVSLPPPNITGALHAGHALANTLQDILIRWHRMRGFSTLWTPGCDHAGIATQSVVEKMLWKRKKLTRHDLGRSEFVKTAWEWKEDYHKRINNSQKLMGGSMDWSREAFTMDENLTRATVEAFCRLHSDRYIYRSKRLVNWCVQLNTALSTLEVENLEITTKTKLSVPGYERKIEFGVLTHFKYKLSDSEETIEIATTRPETMLGDTGIAVHPDDKRYAHLVGKFAVHPFIPDRRLKIVADPYVDTEFGTGAVKLTPAHDFNDYKLGETHHLDFINILNDDGTLNDNAGPQFEGQKRFDARYAVVEELKKLGLFVKQEDHAMKIPRCERSKDVVEPLIKPQWWMRMTEMADAALQSVKHGDIAISPPTAGRSYERWMSGVQDWCLSRQLWWGHQIPAYRVHFEDNSKDAPGDERWVVARSQEEALAEAEEKYPGHKISLERDPDCLDTWFSSGLWPMAILGWPNTEHLDFSRLFPTSLLESGWDILFFWIARMIMLSLKLTGKVPFTEVYCHSLIRDSDGRKMSKSLGNVIDPLDIIHGIDLDSLHAKLLTGNLDEKEVSRAKQYQKTAFPQGIPECGADALRLTLASYTTGGGDINFDIKVMHAYRRFCNKIWQASKYILGQLPDGFTPNEESTPFDLSQKWILHRLNTAVQNINNALTAREFSKSTQIIYQFFYDELCDVFIENSKAILSVGTPEERLSMANTLYTCLDGALRMMHPFMPFITEELWQRLPRKATEKEIPSIMLAPYPQNNTAQDFPEDAEQYGLVLESARAARSLIAEYGIHEGSNVYIRSSTDQIHAVIEQQRLSIKALSGKGVARLEALGPSDLDPPKCCAIFVVSSDLTALLDVSDKVTDQAAEIQKLEQKVKKAQGTVVKQEELIGRTGFDQASDVTRAAELKKLDDARTAVQNFEKTIEQFAKMQL
ncbi:valyl-tRNA synthetase [Viridothelium virens]|uniref:Valine--tRNA ligase, mitochondrial n=1 Tax=Viridothelium virens TaxID=1048519 RepID=A0A6A6HI42_VIRVR|nr:valyl-tRNA synthetase [Viridothelium virens]